MSANWTNGKGSKSPKPTSSRTGFSCPVPHNGEGWMDVPTGAFLIGLTLPTAVLAWTLPGDPA
ncbi:hypothetical protein [Deinococcus hopiensis]|uniref:hypothetical protein n=1 Tax=Deinococcus hopiensis TaxID=309885 RepID=UPI00111BF0FE|nr:hypothetical protein [Deinococcus hopiensis]